MCKQLKKKRIQIHPEVILFLWILLNTYFHLQLLVQIHASLVNSLLQYTVKPRPEAHIDMIRF